MDHNWYCTNGFSNISYSRIGLQDLAIRLQTLSYIPVWWKLSGSLMQINNVLFFIQTFFIDTANVPVFGCMFMRGSPGPSMGWSARNILAWSKVLFTKCSRSFSSDRSNCRENIKQWLKGLWSVTAYFQSLNVVIKFESVMILLDSMWKYH